METQKLLKKIALVENLHIQEQLKKAAKQKNRDWAPDYFDGMLRSALSVAYRPRLGIFKDYNGKLTFDPKTLVGHSYSWYTLIAPIKGKLVLNSYRYSRQTSDHVWSMRGLLKQLGLKYVEVEAPSGLQDYESALSHTLRDYAELIVKNKYAIGKKWDMSHVQKRLKTLKRLGLVPHKDDLKDAILVQETYRRRKLDRLKENRIRRQEMLAKQLADQKALDAIQVIQDDKNERLTDAGLHVFEPDGLPSWMTDRVKLQAIEAGHTTVFVHRERPFRPVW